MIFIKMSRQYVYFLPILLLFFVGKIYFQDFLSYKTIVSHIFDWNSIEFLIRIPSKWVPMAPSLYEFWWGHPNGKQILYWMPPKYPPILLFMPIRLLVCKKFISFLENFPPLLLFGIVVYLGTLEYLHWYLFKYYVRTLGNWVKGGVPVHRIAKGQLISKCSFGVIVSTKIPTKNY